MPRAAQLDAIVIGLGAHGAAALHALARRGKRVLGIEQFGIPHTLGSSHGSSRIIRMCYHEHADYVPLLKRSYALWKQLQATTKAPLINLTGGVYLGRPDHPEILGALDAAKRHNLAHSLLSPAALRKRYPQFTLPRTHVGMVEPTAGVLFPERCITAFVEQALKLGAMVRTHERVLDWSADTKGIRVLTQSTLDPTAKPVEHRARKLIITAGPWTNQLLGDINLPLTVTRQVLAWVHPKNPAAFSPTRSGGGFGVWAHHGEDGFLHYGFPILPDSADAPGLKIALHRPMDAFDPNIPDRSSRPGDEASVRSFLRDRMPTANGELLALRTCLYTNTPDGHFVIDRHPSHPNVVYSSSCSGHGFKFSPVIGEALADLALKGSTKLPIAFLAASRFNALATPALR